jgi:hypothetical protein
LKILKPRQKEWSRVTRKRKIEPSQHIGLAKYAKRNLPNRNNAGKWIMIPIPHDVEKGVQ